MAKTPQLPIWRIEKPLYLKKGDKRFLIHLKQLKNVGFSDSETWGLDFTIAAFILPRLKRLREINNGFPGELTEKSWNEILDKIILAFELRVDEDKFFDDIDDVSVSKIQEGLDLFAKWFLHFWWIFVICITFY